MLGRPFTHVDVLAMAHRLGLESFDFPLHARSRDTYLSCHAKRYAHLLDTIGRVVADRRRPSPPVVLDIGPGFQTALVHAAFPDLTIETLGFVDPHAAAFLTGCSVRHHDFDLNDYQFAARAPGLPRYDIVLFCEVIEHLYTMPEKVLDGMRPHIAADGALIVQTPNAVQWRHRVRMLMGQNPYDRITPSRMGHYREYTQAELREIAAASGFAVRSLELRNYFGLRKRPETTLIDHLLWPVHSLRAGITAVLTPAVRPPGEDAGRTNR
jgi:hypothetical protein